jgi:hypothetical protein
LESQERRQGPDRVHRHFETQHSGWRGRMVPRLVSSSVQRRIRPCSGKGLDTASRRSTLCPWTSSSATPSSTIWTSSCARRRAAGTASRWSGVLCSCGMCRLAPAGSSVSADEARGTWCGGGVEDEDGDTNQGDAERARRSGRDSASGGGGGIARGGRLADRGAPLDRRVAARVT